MTAQATPSVPGLLAERFAKAFDAFVAEVRAAVAAGVLDPAYSSTPGLLMWQTEALPRLEQELAEIQRAFQQSQAGNTSALAQLARDQLGLAKHLDGYPLDFAGPDRAKKLEQLETSVVVAAYQLCAATGTP
jgi:uncharacterized protein CbrC (UPF0167 family)